LNVFAIEVAEVRDRPAEGREAEKQGRQQDLDRRSFRVPGQILACALGGHRANRTSD